MVVRMRATRGHTGNRRSHHALKEPRLSSCSNCGAKHLRHRTCENCGHYRGRMVVDIVAKKEKRQARYDAKLKKMGVDVDEAHKKTAVAAEGSDVPTEEKETATASAKSSSASKKKTADKATQKASVSRKGEKVDKATDKGQEK